MRKTKAQKKQETIETIAFQSGWETLDTRKSDSMDFREMSVWEFKHALEKAYEAGERANKGGRR